MQLYSKNKYRFMRPNAGILKQTGDVAQVISHQLAFGEAFFELEPDQFQEAPDWIKDDNMFKWALMDGDIKVVEGKGGSEGAVGAAKSVEHEGTKSVESAKSVESVHHLEHESARKRT